MVSAGPSSIGLILLLFSGLSLASEAPHPPEKNPAKEISNSKQYQEKLQKLNKLTEQVKNSEQLFQDLVKKNEHAHSEEEKHGYMEQMKSAYAEYSQHMDDLIKVKDEVRYRFPTGEDLNPHAYRQIKKQTSTELEKATGLNANLKDVKRYVEEKYRPFQPAGESASSSAPVSEVKEGREEQKPKRLRLER